MHFPYQWTAPKRSSVHALFLLQVLLAIDDASPLWFHHFITINKITQYLTSYQMLGILQVMMDKTKCHVGCDHPTTHQSMRGKSVTFSS
jgi:hypothetical protein